MPQDRNLGPTWPNLAPSWPHLVPPRGPKTRPRALQDAPKRLQDAPKTPQGPQKECDFSNIRSCVQYVSFGRRRGPALRAEYGAGLRPQCQIPLGRNSAEVIRSLGLDPQTAHAIPPTRGTPNASWLLKVSKTLESEAIFQHKSHAMLT